MQETWRDVAGDGGIRLRVRDVAGPRGAPSVLLHHGLASSQRIWDLMLTDLARTFRVATFDARGHGRSAKPGSGFGFDHVVADALAVSRSLRLGRPIFVGHSWGAMVGLELAARHPRSVAGAVLVDGGVTSMRTSFATWREAREALAPPHLAGMHIEEFRALIHTFMGAAVPVTPELEAIVLSVMRVAPDGTIRPQLSRASHFKVLRAIWEQDPVGLHARLRVPALAIVAHGSGDDGDAAWEQAKRAAAAALRDARASTRVVWIESIHDVPLQHPAARS